MNPEQAGPDEAGVDPAPAPPRSLRRRVARVFLWSLPILFFGEITGLNSLLEVPFRCVFGWIFHVWVTLPVLLPKWSGLLLPLGCMAIVLWLGHGFLRWAVAAKGGTREWRFSMSAGILGLLLLGSAAAIAMSGVVHEIAWLAKEPMFASRFSKVQARTQAMVNVKELVSVIDHFRETHGRYPDSLDELESYRPELKRLLWVNVGVGLAKEKMIYLKPPKELQGDEPTELPLLLSPALPPDGRVAMAKGDLSTTLIMRVKAEEILQNATSHGN